MLTMDLVSLGTKMAARKKELMGKPAKKAAAE
jgi:hypothetical protein